MRLTLIAALIVAPVLAAAGVPEPDGFRMDNYNAPVPETLAGAQAVDAQALSAAMANGAAVIDVMPAARRPPTLPADRPWLPPAAHGCARQPLVAGGWPGRDRPRARCVVPGAAGGGDGRPDWISRSPSTARPSAG